ncbi:homing endonuclease associated repeat-containing protein [Natrialbaceae archaeon A-CW2]
MLDDDLVPWEIEIDSEGSLQVCPSCAQFGPDGTLPAPDEVRVERRYVEEDIESIRSGDVGLSWASNNPISSNEADTQSTGSGRDTRQMLIQLVGVVQQVGRVPTAAELDTDTDFGCLEYEDEFGGIEEALREAGFDV